MNSSIEIAKLRILTMKLSELKVISFLILYSVAGCGSNSEETKLYHYIPYQIDEDSEANKCIEVSDPEKWKEKFSSGICPLVIEDRTKNGGCKINGSQVDWYYGDSETKRGFQIDQIKEICASISKEFQP